MKDDQGFELHPGAAQDITDIWQFIAQENPAAARRFRNAILDAIRKLVSFPHQGRARPDLTSKPVRFQVILDYLIAYAPDQKTSACDRGNSWATQPPHNGCGPTREGMNSAVARLKASNRGIGRLC